MSYQALLFCQDEKTARTVTQVLSELDFQVDPCTETFAAVKKLTSQAFEAIVVDCQNEENASLLLKAARNSVANPTALMVALVEGQAGVAAAFRIGANLVLTKPIAIEQARGTLRVARGLLRKNSGAFAPIPAAVAATPAGPVIAAKPAPAALPSPKPVPAPVPAAVATGTFSRPLTPPPLSPPPPPPPAQRTGPVAPSALRAVAASASANLQSESDVQPQPDAASAGLLESLDAKPYGFTAFEHKPLDPIPAAASEVVSTSEVAAGAHGAVRAALASKPPMSSQDFAGFSAAAAAPAREVPKPAPMPAQVADLFEAPVFGQSMAPPPVAAEATSEPDLNLLSASSSGRSRSPLIAAVVLLALAGGSYFGWSQLHKPAVVNTPVAGPLQPPPPDFGPADAAPAPVPARPAPAPADASPNPVEPLNRFSHAGKPPAPVASDSVTTPVAVIPSHPAPVSPLQVKAEPQRVNSAAPPVVQETADAPSIASLGTSGTPDALNAIAHSTTTSMPAAPSTQRISQGVSDGLLLKRVQPIYPQQAVQLHQQGKVSLLATIAKDGSVKNVKIVSGPSILARAASDAVRQWKYKPYLLNGEPVEVQTEINVNFVPPR